MGKTAIAGYPLNIQMPSGSKYAIAVSRSHNEAQCFTSRPVAFEGNAKLTRQIEDAVQKEYHPALEFDIYPSELGMRWADLVVVTKRTRMSNQLTSMDPNPMLPTASYILNRNRMVSVGQFVAS